MNILITGGAGYVGTELTHKLEADPAVKKIIIYDNLSRANYNLFLGKSKMSTEKVQFVHGDILNSRKLKSEIDKADIVYHLAAKVTTPFADQNPHTFDQINNWGTAELSYLIENSQVKKLIYTSSVSVYGASEEEVDIKTTSNPQTFYGISKLHGEQHVNVINNSHTQVYVLRLGNIYGYSKSMRFDSVINKFMFEGNFNKRVKINGDGAQSRSFVHIEEVSQALKNIAFNTLPPDTYNIVSSTYTINEIIDELKALYPTLEMVFTNQNMAMRSIKVQPDKRINSLAHFNEKSFHLRLEEFRNHFSF